jgi:hypothetical protein
MEILKQYKYTRNGTDCLIYTYVGLIKITQDFYIVLRADSVKGGWTGDAAEVTNKVFNDPNSA